MSILAFLIIKTPIFIIFISLCFIKCILNIWYYKVYKHILFKREKRAFLVLCILDIILYTQLCVANLFSLPYSMVVFCFLIIYFIQIYSNCQCQNEEEIDVIFNFFGSIYLSLMVLENSLILFKIDGLLDWYWRQVFCGYWIMFSILGGVVLIMTLFSLATIEGIFNRRNWTRPITIDCKKIFLTWLSWAAVFSLLVIFVRVLMNLNILLDSKQKNTKKDDMIIAIFLLLVWNFFMVVIILVVKKTLYDIFEELFDQMEETDDEISFDEEESMDIKPKKEKPKVNLNEIPGFIQKFTATYFKFKKSILKRKRKIKKKNGSKKKTNEHFFLR